MALCRECGIYFEPRWGQGGDYTCSTCLHLHALEKNPKEPPQFGEQPRLREGFDPVTGKFTPKQKPPKPRIRFERDPVI